MNATEVILVIVAIVLVIAVPWVGTLIGIRNFYEHLDAWRAKTQLKVSRAEDAEETAV